MARTPHFEPPPIPAPLGHEVRAPRGQQGEIAVELDGQTYTLALTLNAMIEVEALFARSFDEVMTVASTTGSATHLRALVWAMLRKHHPTITLEQAGELVTGTNLSHLSRMIGRAVARAEAPPTPVVAGDSAPPTAPRGRARHGE